MENSVNHKMMAKNPLIIQIQRAVQAVAVVAAARVVVGMEVVLLHQTTLHHHHHPLGATEVGLQLVIELVRKARLVAPLLVQGVHIVDPTAELVPLPLAAPEAEVVGHTAGVVIHLQVAQEAEKASPPEVKEVSPNPLQEANQVMAMIRLTGLGRVHNRRMLV